MEIDKTTLNDLSIFDKEEEFSVFNKLNLTRTVNGREQLRYNFNTPLNNIEAIQGIQQTVQLIMNKADLWPMQISNGTIMVVEKFYETVIDDIPPTATSFSAMSYKLLHGPDFSLVKYSAQHCFDFIKCMQEFVNRFLQDEVPTPLKKILLEIKKLIERQQFSIVKENNKSATLTNPQLLQFAHFVRYHDKNSMLDLIDMYSQLDAWYGMANAVKK